jgi:hypothetical protein
MEHPINRSIDALENDPSLSVTALTVVLALFFIFYFTVRAAMPELPLHVHHALADLPLASEQAADVLSMLW